MAARPPGFPSAPMVPMPPAPMGAAPGMMLSPSLIAKQQAEIAAQMEQQATFMIGYQICTALVADTLQVLDPKLYELRSSADCWVVEAGTGDMKLHSLLEAMKIPHKAISSEQFPLVKLYPNQTVFVNCSNETFMDVIDEDSVRRVAAFVNEGGVLVTFGAAVRLLERAFPGRISRGLKRTADYVNAKVKVLTPDPALKAYSIITQECVLEPGSLGVRIQDKANVTVLATIPPNVLSGERPAGVKFSSEKGQVYHFICELCERERVSSNPKNATLPFLQQHSATKATIQAWECAAKCGFSGATPIAQSAYPLMLLISYVALAHKYQWKDYQQPEEPQMLAQPVMAVPPEMLAVAAGMPVPVPMPALQPMQQ